MTIALTGTGGYFTRAGKLGAVVRTVNLFRGTGALLLASVQRTSNVLTVTTQENHGYATNDVVTLAGITSDTTMNGTGLVITVTSANAFTCPSVGSNGGPFTNQGASNKTGGAGYFAVGPMVDNIAAQFQATDQNMIDRLYNDRDNYRTIHGTYVTTMRTRAQNTLVQMADEDVRLTSRTVALAMSTLISQMQTAVQSVQKPSITATVTAGTNNGDGVLLVSLLGGNGIQQDYVFSEQISVVCIGDSSAGGTPGSESFGLAGDVAVQNSLDWNWPAGSGANTGLQAVPATGGQSKLLNGDFDSWTATNTPNSWSIDPASGGAGVDIFQSTSPVYSGTACLQLTGTAGAPLTGVYQVPTGGMVPDTVYAVNGWLRKSAGLAAGTIEFDLWNGTTVIQDDNAVNNAVVIASAGVPSGSWQAFNGFFRTPKVLPATLQFRVKVTTALTSGQSLYVDRLSFTAATQAYLAGPYVALFSGATKFIKGDSFSVNVVNAYNSKWQLMAEKLFGMRSLKQQLPSSLSPTIADSLIG